MHAPAAVSGQRRADDVAGRIDSQVEGESGHLRRLAPAPYRDFRHHADVDLRAVQQRPVHLAGEHAGDDAVDGDPSCRPLQRQHPVELQHAAFAYRVRGALGHPDTDSSEPMLTTRP